MEFNNERLLEALESFKQEPSRVALHALALALLNTPLLVPAIWDKDPVSSQDGNFTFEQDTQISLNAVRNQEGDLFVPIFTSEDQVKTFYQDHKVQCLALSLHQIMVFIDSSQGEIVGLVGNPGSSNIPFQTSLLKEIMEQATPTTSDGLMSSQLVKGTTVNLRKPQEKVEDLEAALIASGFQNPNINSIYLQERGLEDDTFHWFVVVDANKMDPAIFRMIGENCQNVSHGKKIEFIFTDQQLGKDIADRVEPIYTKLSA